MASSRRPQPKPSEAAASSQVAASSSSSSSSSSSPLPVSPASTGEATASLPESSLIRIFNPEQVTAYLRAYLDSRVEHWESVIGRIEIACRRLMGLFWDTNPDTPEGKIQTCIKVEQMFYDRPLLDLAHPRQAIRDLVGLLCDLAKIAEDKKQCGTGLHLSWTIHAIRIYCIEMILASPLKGAFIEYRDELFAEYVEARNLAVIALHDSHGNAAVKRCLDLSASERSKLCFLGDDRGITEAVTHNQYVQINLAGLELSVEDQRRLIKDEYKPAIFLPTWSRVLYEACFQKTLHVDYERCLEEAMKHDSPRAVRIGTPAVARTGLNHSQSVDLGETQPATPGMGPHHSL